MLHEHNEYINADTYLKGIEIYERIIETMGNFDWRPIRFIMNISMAPNAIGETVECLNQPK